MRKDIFTYISTLPKDSLYDNMTQIYSKKTCLAVCNFCIENNIPFAFFFIDFDTFKKVNDNLGHPTGDKALIDSGRMLKESVSDKGIVCRFGGDEFAIVVPDVQDKKDVWEIARTYSEYFRHHSFDYLLNVFFEGRITLTSGIVRYPLDGKDMPSLLSRVDKALYRGKSKGKNCFIIYDKNLHDGIDKNGKKNSLNVSGLIRFIYETFDENESRFDALRYASELLGNYYQEAIIEYIDENNQNILYLDSSQKDVNSYFLPYDSITFQREEWFKQFSLDAIKDMDYDSSLWKNLEKTGCRSGLLLKILSEKKKNAFYVILARRDKIWGDDEFHMFETLAFLYSSLNSHMNP